MTTPPGEGPNELADMPHLFDVQATDALLDRLGARTPTQDDLADPIVAELAHLPEFADASPIPPPGIERLIEVLDGRPLFMFDRGNAAFTEADEPIDLGEVRPAARMIDLTSAARAGSAAASSAVSASSAASAASGSVGSDTDLEDDAELAARIADDESDAPAAALGGARIIRLVRRPVTKTGWQGAMQQLALPAASVVALLALGGGVSAVVTGDPMSPVYGVTKVASAFVGNDDKTKITKVTSDITAATIAVRRNEPAKAKAFIKSATDNLAGVTDDDTSKKLQGQINDLRSSLPPTAPSDPTATVSATPAVTPTSPIVATAAPSTSASAPVETTPTATSPSTTTPATTSPDSPTAAPSATAPAPAVTTP